MSNKIVPFGKYKGQPVEAMAEDKSYCEWLSQQDWFRSQYTAIHTLIINNFSEPTETPEHNALQAKFTDKEWVLKFGVAIVGGYENQKKRFENTLRRYALERDKENFKSLGLYKDTNGLDINKISVEYEKDGADVEVSFGWPSQIPTARVECKPSLGDDYPAVLRQMKANNRNYWASVPVLLLGDGGYCGAGATFDQVVEIFAASKIKIIKISDI